MNRIPYDGDAFRIDWVTNTLYYPIKSRPYILANHIDGPLLCLRDGQLHWLNLWERVLFSLGLTDAASLEDKWWDRPWNSL